MVSMIVKLFVLAIVISTYNFGKAWMADRLGDPTARNMGRMSLNPFDHMDIVSLLMMMIVGIGISKEMVIRTSNFNNKTRKRDTVLVYLSGLMFSILLAVICAIGIRFVNIGSAKVILMNVMMFSISFGVWNLMPIPGLDGYNIIKELAPLKYRDTLYQYESMSMIIFLIVIVTNAHLILMNPIVNFISKFVFLIAF